MIATKDEQQKNKMLRRGAYIFMAIMVLAASVMLYIK